MKFLQSAASALRLSLVLLCFLSTCIGAAPLPSSWFRSTDLFQLSSGNFGNPQTVEQVRNLPTTLPGVDTVALQWMWEQASATSTEVYATKRTPNTSDITGLVRAAQSVGLQTFLKPLVVFPNGGLMNAINPSNLTAWFASYGAQILAVAQLAQAINVTILAVGIELQQISTNPAALPLWTALIASVRESYSGTLTYCSEPLQGETAGIPFWPQLHFVGIDLYIPFVINRSANASLIVTRSEMVELFSHILENYLLLWYKSTTLAAQGIGIALTEIGYPSSNAGMQTPWLLPAGTCTGNYAMNITAQATAFSVAFEVLTRTPETFVGVNQFWMGQPGTRDYNGTRYEPDSIWACGWTPIGKPETMAVLAEAFARS